MVRRMANLSAAQRVFVSVWIETGSPSKAERESGLPAATTADLRIQRAARDALARYEERMARALASVVNVLDPDVIVLGGGMSNIASLYEHVPRLWAPFVFSDSVTTRLVPARHGDASGVRGAAWLWPASPGRTA